MNGTISEIRLFGGNFAPRNWFLCQGQLLSIAQFTPLFSLIGTIYGGDGRTTFALPDLRGRVPIKEGLSPGLGNYRLGQRGGAESITLTLLELASHTHSTTATTTVNLNVNASSEPASLTSPAGNFPAKEDANASPLYADSASNNTLNPTEFTGTINTSAVIGSTGGGQAHENRMPYLALNFIICHQGNFPSRA